MDTTVNFWGKGLGYGVIIWIIMYIVLIFSMYSNIYGNGWIGLIIAIIAGVVSYLFALASMPKDAGQAFMYGIIWVIVGLILDAIITRMSNPGMYSYWAYWLEYLLILCAPFLAIKRPSAA